MGELLLRNSQIYNDSTFTASSNQLQNISINEVGELINEYDLTKNEVKKNLLQSMLAHSKKYINTNQNEDIKQNMNLIQERVYWRATTDPNTYFHKLFQQLKQNHPNMQESISKVDQINDKVASKILTGEVSIQKRQTVLNKRELYVLESSFYKRRLSNKNIQLEHKINSLDNHIDYLKSLRSPNNQFDKTLSTRAMYKSVHEFSADNFLPNSEKNTDAKSFLYKMKKEQQLTKAQLDEKKKKEEERKKKVQDEIEEQKQQERKKRHEELLKSFQMQRENQKLRQEFIQKNQNEFQMFYKKYQEQKRLHEIMEEGYKQKIEMEAQQDRLSKLRELYKPHRSEDFEEHYRRYRDFKKSEIDRLQLKRNSFQSTKNLQINNSLWRGRFHDLVDEELRNQQRQCASEDKKIKLDRQKQYSSLVKQNHVPKLDLDKQMELSTRNTDLHKPKNLIKIQLEKQEIETEPSSYQIEYIFIRYLKQQGLKNIEFAKKYNREHKKQEDEKVKEQQKLIPQQQSDDTQLKSKLHERRKGKAIIKKG